MEIKISVQALEMAIAGLASGVWDWDLATGTQVWSDQFFKLLGYLPGELDPDFDRFSNDIIHPQDKNIWIEAATCRTEAQPSFDVLVRLKTRDRGFRSFKCAGNTRFELGKAIQIVGTINDIHEKVAHRDVLLKNEILLKEAGRLAKIGAWELNLATKERYWSDEVYAIHELDKNSGLDLENVIDFYKPWARTVIQNVLYQATTYGTPWDLELALQSAKGNEIWVRSIGNVVWENGVPVRLYGVIQDLTESRMMEEKIRVIFNHSTDAHILLGSDGIIDCNQAAIEMLGCKDKVEMLAQHPAVFSPEYQPDGTLSFEKARQIDKLAYETGYQQFEWVHRRINGEEFPVEVTLKPIQFNNKEVLLAVVHDITARKRAGELLIRNEAMLAETQMLTHSGSWEADLITGDNYWSDETFRIFGLQPVAYPPDYESFFQQVHPDDVDLFKETMRTAIVNSVSSTCNFRIILPDGYVKFIHLIAKPIHDFTGKVIKLFGAIMDIDEQKKLEIELITAKEQAEAAAVAKSQFLSTMSHEIRTPMNAVIGFTHLLLEHNPTPQQEEYINMLKYSAENLLVLINDILDFSKIEEGKIDFEQVDFNLLAVMENIRFGMLHTAQEKGVQLKLMVDSELDVSVMGDPVRLGQILTNLISNAVKFTKHGKVVVSAFLIKQDDTHRTIEFKIEDTGIGIAADKLDYIFDRFTQASSDTTRKYGGSGLGLTITKRLLELQGSEIKVTSQPGKGTVFSFILELKNGQKQVDRQSPVPTAASGLRGTRILLAEDNTTNVLLMRNFFRRWEVICDVAENGQQAYEMVQAFDYDMVLMDLQMPELDGYQATSKIRSLDGVKYKEIPIIALTASATLDIKDLAFAVGMNDYITKPFSPHDLQSKISFYNKKSVAAPANVD